MANQIKIKGTDFGFETSALGWIYVTGEANDTSMLGNLKNKGNYIHYRDNNGLERRSLGVLTGNARAAGNIAMAADGFLYGDYSGDERKLGFTEYSITAEAVDSNAVGWAYDPDRLVFYTYDQVHELDTGDVDEDRHIDLQGFPRLNYAQFTADDGTVMIGQMLNLISTWPYGVYFIGRGGLSFDLTTLIGRTLTEASITFRVKLTTQYFPTDDILLYIVQGTYIESTGIVAADYAQLVNNTTSWGSITYGTWRAGGTGAWATISLNATGLAALQAAIDAEDAYFIVGMRAGGEIAKSYSASEQFQFSAGPTAGENLPQLVAYE